MVVDTGSCFTLVRPDIVNHCRIMDSGTIHEAKTNLGHSEFNHLVFVANITDDRQVWILLNQDKIQLDLENSGNAGNEITGKMIEQLSGLKKSYVTRK